MFSDINAQKKVVCHYLKNELKKKKKTISGFTDKIERMSVKIFISSPLTYIPINNIFINKGRYGLL